MNEVLKQILILIGYFVGAVILLLVFYYIRDWIFNKFKKDGKNTQQL